MPQLRSVLLHPVRSLNDTHLRVLFSVLALLSLAWIVLAGWNSFSASTMHTDECLWETIGPPGRQQLFVATITRGGAADRAGVRVGDRVVAINGTMLDPAVAPIEEDAQQLLNAAPLDVPISYVVERDGRLLELAVELTDGEAVPVRLLGRTLVAFTVLWLLIGLMVVMVMPKGRIQGTFFFTSLTAVFAFTLPLAGSPDLRGVETVGYALTFIQMMMASAFISSWVRFCSVFPVDQKLFDVAPARAILLLPPSLMLVAMLSYTLALATHEEVIFPIITTVLAGVVALVGVLYFLGGIVLLYRGYRRLGSAVEHRPMRAILAGATLTALAFAAIPFTFAFPIIGIEVGSTVVVVLFLTLSLPLSFGYAIFRYQVMNFRLVVRTTVVYVVTMTFVVGIYLVVAYAISQAFGAVLGRAADAVELVVFVLCLLLFDPLKRELQAALENRFFPRHRDYSAHLAEFATALERRRSIGDVARLIASTLRSTLGLNETAVVLIGPAGAAVAAHDGDGSPIEHHEVAALAELIASTQGITALEVCCAEALDTLVGRFAFGVALNAHGRYVGYALTSRPGEGQYLSGRQQQFISAVATQGAAAIEVARLYEEELARERYEEQLAAARHIQRTLLTSELPALAGLTVSVAARSAFAVGGDYFRVQRIDDARSLVISADVSGKGLPASLHMAQLHGMVSVAGSRANSPAEMLALMNDHLYAELARGTFVTATAMMFDVERGVVHLARAGHTPILVRNAGGLSRLVPRGVPLGVLHTREFLLHLEERSLRLTPGDQFILHSDGVSEAMNDALEEFGDDRVTALLESLRDAPPDEVCARLAESVESFRNGAEQNDDVTIVVVRTDAVGQAIPPTPLETTVVVDGVGMGELRSVRREEKTMEG